MEITVADAQQSAEQARIEARERGEMSRAERFRAAAERIGGVAGQADAAAERAGQTSVADTPPAEAIEAPPAEPEAAEEPVFGSPAESVFDIPPPPDEAAEVPGFSAEETPAPVEEEAAEVSAELLAEVVVDEEPVDEDEDEEGIFDIESDPELAAEVEGEELEPMAEVDLEPADFVKDPEERDPDLSRRSEAITGVWAVPADAAEAEQVDEDEDVAEIDVEQAEPEAGEEDFEAADEDEDEDLEEAEIVDEEEGDDYDEADSAPVPDDGERISLATASFEDLRKIGMSVTQAKRVLRYRDERGLSSVADLEQVPGFPRSFLDGLDGRMTD